MRRRADEPHARRGGPAHRRRQGAALAGRLLVACVRGQAWREPSAEVAGLAARLLARPAARGRLAAAAGFHGVAGYAYRALRHSGAVAPAELEALRAGTLHSHLRALADLPLLDEALAGAGIPWLVVKGPVLAELHGAPDLRSYGDLDLVVPAAGFAGAIEALEAAGARVLAHNWWHRLEVLAGEVPLVLPSGTLVDLHWHVLGDHDVRRAFPLSMPALLARARDVEVGGHPVRTLDAVDGAVALLLHTAASGGNRLVWLKDVERLFAVERPDVALLAARAHDSGAALAAAVVLGKVRATLGGAPAAPARLDGSRTWRALAAAARHLPPPQRAGPGGSVDRLISRSTRADLHSSAAELVRRARRWGRLGGRGDRPGGAVTAARDHDAGAEAAGRRAFLAAVTRQP